ncbi:transposase [Streptomyces sp. NBC_00154]|uniref:IS110 family transposase n=1 Tax=Streptomyces sp. NBC_00154 TaxID=2975670 RepID=UPI002B1DCE12|nr:transposase [Streptomyces sp. NBC_00154]
MLTDVLTVSEDVVWAVDVADGMAALWTNILLNHGQQVVYIPGLTVNRASAGYRGMGKTDAKDAMVTGRGRSRLPCVPLRPWRDEGTPAGRGPRRGMDRAWSGVGVQALTGL